MTCPYCADRAARIEYLEAEVAALHEQMKSQFEASDYGALRKALALTPLEAFVALALYDADGKPVSRGWLVDNRPNQRTEGESDRLIPVVICRLRKKMGEDAIKTVWGRGWFMTPEGQIQIEAALS